MSEHSSYTTNYGQHHTYQNRTINTINNIEDTLHMNRSQYLPTREAIKEWLSEFYLDFKAGFLPMFLYVTAIVIVIAGLTFITQSKETTLTILFLGVGVYITAMLGGLKRLNKQSTIFSNTIAKKGSKENPWKEDDLPIG